MGFDVGVVNIEYLERPEGIVYDFIVDLAIYANCSGEGNAFGFFSKEEIKEYAKDFLKDRKPSQEQFSEVERWIESLPWDEYESIVLTFNW